MIIIQRIDDFLQELFPRYKTSKGDINVLKEELSELYSYGPYKPRIEIKDGLATIEIDTHTIEAEEKDFSRAVAFCERRNWNEAKKILRYLIKKNPTNSEYHRNLGQVYSEEGNQDEAIDELIDALRWNPRNSYAAIMMGNIFSKFKDDIDTATKYYNVAIEVNPKDFIAINNLGTTLLKIGKWKEGLKYLEQSHEINPTYPNNLYGLALAHDQNENTLVAFNYSTQCMKSCDKNNQNLYDHALSLTVKTSEELAKKDTGKNIFNEYKTKLEFDGGKEIRVETATTLETFAKFEYAENHNRNYHLIKYRPEKQAVEHLIMHELVHLELALQARDENENKLFIWGGEIDHNS